MAVVSAARLLANRRNALKSSGPKTVEGKAQSRQNAFKHGLTGEGLVLPPEQETEVSRRFETLKGELQPSGEAGRILLRRFAFLSVRLEKCEEYDTSYTAKRVRHAVEMYDDQRSTALEELVAHLATDPLTVTRRLQTSPEGVDWLIAQCVELRGDLTITERQAWTMNHWGRLEQLLGRSGGVYKVSRTHALTQGLGGFFTHLDQADGGWLGEPERIEWIRAELVAIIDTEVTRLQGVKASMNRTMFEQDRAEVPSRVLFDPGPEMVLARKYEAATERAMYKALNQFHEVELAALEGEPVAPSAVVEEPSETLGSFLPEPSTPTEDLVDDEPARLVARPEALEEDFWPRNRSNRTSNQPGKVKRPRPLQICS